MHLRISRRVNLGSGITSYFIIVCYATTRLFPMQGKNLKPLPEQNYYIRSFPAAHRPKRLCHKAVDHGRTLEVIPAGRREQNHVETRLNSWKPMRYLFATLALLLLLTGYAPGQAPAPLPAFEAVDVHISARGGTPSGRFSLPSGRMEFYGTSILMFIRIAYNLPNAERREVAGIGTLRYRRDGREHRFDRRHPANGSSRADRSFQSGCSPGGPGRAGICD